MTIVTNIRGIVRGRTIELESELSLPEGQVVKVSVEAETTVEETAAGSRLPGFGALADLSDEIDEFNEWYRQARRQDLGRPELEP